MSCMHLWRLVGVLRREVDVEQEAAVCIRRVFRPSDEGPGACQDRVLLCQQEAFACPPETGAYC